MHEHSSRWILVATGSPDSVSISLVKLELDTENNLGLF